MFGSFAQFVQDHPELSYQVARSAFNYARSAMPRSGPFGAIDRPRKRQRGAEVCKDKQGYVQLTRIATAEVGRTLRRQEYLNRCIESNNISVIDRWQALSSTSGLNGSFFLGNVKSGVTPNQLRKCPLYCWELNTLRTNQNAALAGTAVYASVASRLQFSEAASNSYQFSHNIYGYKSDGTTGATWDFNTWQAETQPYTAIAANSPYEKAMVDWVEIKLDTWGAQLVPSSVEMIVCRLTDSDLQPWGGQFYNAGTQQAVYAEPDNTAEPVEWQKFNKFWQMQMDNTNGCNSRKQTYPGMTPGGMKVLYRKRFEFNPTTTIEGDPAGHQFSHRCFIKLHELTSYVSPETPGATTPLGAAFTALTAANGWVPNTTSNQQLSLCGNKKARLFLFVKGINSKEDAGDAYGTAPSFDILIRRRVTFIS